MQIDPLTPGVSVAPTPSEPKGKLRAEPPPVADNDPLTPLESQITRPTALPAPERVTVSVDSSHIVVYRFLDGKTGAVLSQTPAEEVLRVVRGIQELALEAQKRENSTINVRG